MIDEKLVEKLLQKASKGKWLYLSEKTKDELRDDEHKKSSDVRVLNAVTKLEEYFGCESLFGVTLAKRDLRIEAEQGNPKAYYFLGMASAGAYGFYPNAEEAKNYFDKAVELGVPYPLPYKDIQKFSDKNWDKKKAPKEKKIKEEPKEDPYFSPYSRMDPDIHAEYAKKGSDEDEG